MEPRDRQALFFETPNQVEMGGKSPDPRTGKEGRLRCLSIVGWRFEGPFQMYRQGAIDYFVGGQHSGPQQDPFFTRRAWPDLRRIDPPIICVAFTLPHRGQTVFKPALFSSNVALITYRWLQSSHWYSYIGTVTHLRSRTPGHPRLLREGLLLRGIHPA